LSTDLDTPPATKPAKRAGRPAAPLTVDEMTAAYRRQVQTARKANNAAAALLAKLRTAEGDIYLSDERNWDHLDRIAENHRSVEYRLYTAQLTVTRTPYTEPNGKLD
jgi:hypothetical protein